MALEHLKHQPNGRTFKVVEDGQPTGQQVYKAFIGQKNVDLGGGDFTPYVWDEPGQSIRYGNHLCEFNVDGFQTIREYGSVETLIDDQRFEVQYWQTQAGGRWRILDLHQIGLTVDQQEDHCIITRNLSDGVGNTLDIDFLFRPTEKVRLTFRLHVVDANLYRIRFQNTGIAGEVTEVPCIAFGGENLGIHKLLFENIWFQWDETEIGIHEGYTIEDQAGGKKLDLFLGDFDLPADGSIIVSPDTWGPTVTGDDGVETDDTTWSDDFSGYIGAGAGAASESLDHAASFVVTDTDLPGAVINSGTYLSYGNIIFNSGDVDITIKICDSQDVGTWGSGNRPSQQNQHPDTVPWLVDTAGAQNTPNLASLLQARIDGEDIADPYESGDKISLILLNNGNSDGNYYFDLEESITLTIDYTPAPSGYTLTADPGSYSKTGTEAGLLVDRKLDMDAGSFSLSGSIAALLKSYALDSESGLYSLAGQDINLLRDALINIDPGSYDVEAIDYGSEEYDSVFINGGFETYTIDGLDITLAINSFLGGSCYDNIDMDILKVYRVTFHYTYNSGAEPSYRFAWTDDLSSARWSEQMAGTGTYTFYSLGTPYHGFGVGFGASSFAVSNLSIKEVISQVNLLKGSKIEIESGVYNKTGSNAELLKGNKIIVDPGSHVIAGSDVNFLLDRIIQIESGIYSIVGQDVTLIYTPLGAYVLTTDSGIYNLTGQDINLLLGRLIQIDPGSYGVTGQDINLLLGRLIQIDPGSYGVTGQDATLLHTGVGSILITESGLYNLTGQDVNLLHDFILDPGSGLYSLAGQDVSLLRSYPLIADPGSYAMIGQDITFIRTLLLNIESGNYVLTGQDINLIFSAAARLDSIDFSLLKRNIDFSVKKRNMDFTLIERNTEFELD